MFTGVIESKSHEGGFLVSFTGSSPALESIIINAESGIYIGKVDAVLGNTNAPLAHVAHIDRKLDLDTLIGVEVGIRAKKQREERSRGSERDGRRDDRRGGRDDGGYQSRDRQGGRFERNDRGRGDNRGGSDWDCPKCQNSNFAFRTECNRCGEPKGHGGDRERSDDRRGGRDDRGNRGGRGGEIYNDNDWDCPKCQNSNFAFRNECNRCGEPRTGGGGRGRSDDRRGGRNDRSRGGDRGYQSRDRQGGRFERGGGGGNEDRRDGDWDCSKCQNSNFAFRTECNQCGASRGGGGGRGPRRDTRERTPQRNSDDRPPRREFSERPPRREGDRPPRRDGRDRRDERGTQNRDSYNQSRSRGDDRPAERKSREPRTFRKSRGNGPGHAHNRPPKPLTRERED
ncbi:MAG: hypothetical protein ISR21_01720 [Candidatus Poseidoniaceae archaeon]|nr:hypothetical protein [Candidatus Poseidoniaceae archaeon]